MKLFTCEKYRCKFMVRSWVFSSVPIKVWLIHFFEFWTRLDAQKLKMFFVIMHDEDVAVITSTPKLKVLLEQMMIDSSCGRKHKKWPKWHETAVGKAWLWINLYSFVNKQSETSEKLWKVYFVNWKVYFGNWKLSFQFEVSGGFAREISVESINFQWFLMFFCGFYDCKSWKTSLVLGESEKKRVFTVNLNLFCENYRQSKI